MVGVIPGQRERVATRARMRQVDRHQDFEPAGNFGIDSALAGEPSSHRVPVFADAPDQLPLGPSQGEQAEGQAIWGHRRRWRQHVSILDT